MSRPAIYLKPKVEEFRCVIDLAWLRRTGARVPGYNGHITWSYQGTVKASVAYTVEQAGLRLRYKRGKSGRVDFRVHTHQHHRHPVWRTATLVQLPRVQAAVSDGLWRGTVSVPTVPGSRVRVRSTKMWL